VYALCAKIDNACKSLHFYDFVYKTMYKWVPVVPFIMSVRVTCLLIGWRKVKQPIRKRVSCESGAGATQNSGKGTVVRKMMDILYV